MENIIENTWWSKISELGLGKIQGEKIQRLRIFNRIVAISVLTYLCFIPISGIVGSLLYFLILLGSVLALFFCLWMNKRRLFQFSQLIFLSVLNISIFLISAHLGESSGVFLCFIPISSLALLFYRSVYWSIIPLIFSFIAYSSVDFAEGIIPQAQVNDWRITLMYFSIIFGVIMVGFIYNVFFKISSEKKDSIYLKINQDIKGRNEEILENIKVAKSIQVNLLPFDFEMKELFPASFVFYQPRDIVSGDFYWIEKKNELKYCAVIDCTGHGVPGSFVSILGHQGLNRCINDFNLSQPSEILHQLHKIMANALRKEESLILDGMDLSLISFDESKSILSFCGANNSILIVRENGKELLECEVEYRGISHSIYKIKGQQQSVGSEKVSQEFVQIDIQILQGDRIYMHTDGYVDQFGGPNNKKMMHKALRKLILSVQDLPLEKQDDVIRDYFEEWKGSGSQIDDVCVIGIELET